METYGTLLLKWTNKVFSEIKVLEGKNPTILKIRPTPACVCYECFTHCVLVLLIIFTVIGFYYPFHF